MFRWAGPATALLLCRTTLFAGIVLDGSFGTSGALPGPNYMIQAGFGKQVGTNLFHSFNQFNLINTESATFTGPSNIHNIVSRVTGGSPSSIDGTINSQIQGANLFFVNPFGVVFGSHAQLNVSGSVAVSTAHYLKMADGGRFNASLGGSDSLTSAPISAFGFLNSNPAPVSIANATLNIAAGKSFSVIAGDILLNGTQLSAPGGSIGLFSARATGELAYDEAAPTAHFRDSTLSAFGDITIQSSRVAIDSPDGGGKIGMRGGQVLITDSTTVSSSNQGSNVGGDIELTADALSVLNGARVVAQTVSSGDGGNMSVQATDLTVNGDNGVRNSSIRSNATSGTGNAGSLVVNTTNLSLTNGGTLNGNTLSAGRGAPMTVNANNAIMSDPGTLGLGSGIFESVRPGATGNASDVTVNIGQTLTILNGGAISNTTFSTGNGGNLNVHAVALTIDGSGVPGIFTGIATDSNPGATGNTGSLTVTVDQGLSIFTGGQISTTTFTSGNGGNLNLHAGTLSIDGSADPSRNTGIRVETEGAGAGGNLTVTVDQAMNIIGGGQVSTAALSSGNGGSLDLHAGSLTIDGSLSPNQTTGLAAESFGTGDAGNMTIQVDQALTLTGGGSINAVTMFSGRGGDITISAGSLLVTGGSFISADSLPGATGNAGNLTISVQGAANVSAGGIISADTFSSGNGGDLTLHAGSLTIDGSATPGFFTGITVSTNAGATGNAGDLTIAVDQGLNILGNGSITSGTFSSGKGGNVSVHAGSLSIDGSATAGFFTGIAADTDGAATGDAGTITVNVDGALNLFGGGEITARTFTSGNAGSIDVHAGSLSIDSTGSFFTGIFATAFSTGNAGNLTIAVDQALSVIGGGEISVDTFASGQGGALNIQAGSLFIDGSGAIPGQTLSGVFANTLGGGNAGDLTINVDGGLTIVARGQIGASTFSSGKGGDISVHAGSVLIDGSATPAQSTGIFASSSTGSIGNAGSISLVVDGLLSMIATGEISTDTFTSGKAGDVNIRAGSMLIDGSGTPGLFTGVADGSGQNATGDAGNITVQVAGSLTMTGSGAQLAANSLSSGNGGFINVAAGSLLLSDSSEIGALAAGTGDAGSISLQTDHFQLNTKASVDVSTLGSGTGGDISLNAGTANIQSNGSISSETTGSGNAGNILIKASALSIGSSGVVSTSTRATGNGGDVTVNGGSILLNDGFVFAGAFSGSTGNAGAVTMSGKSIVIKNRSFVESSTSALSTGNAGAVTLNANSILLDTGAAVFSNSFGTGNGGEVTMKAKSLVIQGMSDPLSPTTVDTSAVAGGNAGDVTLTADSVVVRGGGKVSSSSSNIGNAGNIFIKGGDVMLNHGAIQTTALGQSTGNGGNITIQANNLRMFNGRDLGISANASTNGGSINLRIADLVFASDTPITAAAGNTGGNITIVRPLFIVLNNSPISANASIGQGGNINVVASSFFAQNSPVTATGAIANGTVNITAPVLDLGAELITLPSSLVDAQNQLRERCTALIQGDFSSFISIGRGGTEPEPDELEDAF